MDNNKTTAQLVLQIITLVLVLAVLGLQVGSADPLVQQALSDQMTDFTGVRISGSETDALLVDQLSTGDIVEFRDGGTAVWKIADGGAVTATGAQTFIGDTQIRNGATGNVVLDFRDYADTTDDDMAHSILTTNCTDATTGAEDCDFTIGVVEAGAAAVTRFNLDADGGITLGDSTNGTLTSISTGATFRNAATGSVTLDFRDYADTTDDDMAHGLVGVNCTDTSTGAEDCDTIVQIVEAGAAAETRLNFDADGGITLGSANNNLVTLTTDSTGDGELVVPAESISAGEITNLARNISIGLLSFIDCETDAGALIGFDTTADTLADYVNSATDGLGFVIRFDDTGGTEDQSSSICANFTVPPGYASGGAFIIRAVKDAHTAATEVINCQVSVNGAALEAAGTVTTSAAASTSYTCTPTIAALAAGDSVSFTLYITSDSTMNDLVDIAAVAFQYTATQ